MKYREKINSEVWIILYHREEKQYALVESVSRRVSESCALELILQGYSVNCSAFIEL